MPSVSETFGSGKTLKAADLPDEGQVFTIKDVEDKTFDDGVKLIVRFEETDLALVSNLTNSRTIAGLYGDDTDGWAGQRITLYPTETVFNSRMTPCIRVRSKPPRPAQPARRQAAPAPANQRPAPRPALRTAPPMTQEEVDDADADIPF